MKTKTQRQLTHLIDLHGWSSYLHAINKHPFFCDRICSDEQNWSKVAKTIKLCLQYNAASHSGKCTAKDVLDAEMAEVYAAVIQGDYYHARCEIMDAFAVLMRMDDMLREMEGPEALPKLLEDDGIECKKDRAAEDFAQLVKEMRSMQKAYFRTRDAQTLQACKRLESEVDRRIADIEHEDKQYE